MSSVPDIAVKGARRPIEFPGAFPWVRLVQSTGVTDRINTASVEFHPLSLFSSRGH